MPATIAQFGKLQLATETETKMCQWYLNYHDFSSRYIKMIYNFVERSDRVGFATAFCVTIEIL